MTEKMNFEETDVLEAPETMESMHNDVQVNSEEIAAMMVPEPSLAKTQEETTKKASIFDRIKSAFTPKLTPENVQDKLKDLISTQSGYGFSGADYIQFANKYDLDASTKALAQEIYAKAAKITMTDDAKALQVELNALKQQFAQEVRKQVNG